MKDTSLAREGEEGAGEEGVAVCGWVSMRVGEYECVCVRASVSV